MTPPVLPSPVAVLGLGRVGRFLALRLAERGVDVRGWDPVEGPGTAAVRARGLGVTVGDLPDWVSTCDRVLLPVADRGLEPVARQLGKLTWHREGVVLHTSGFHPAAVLRAHLPTSLAVGSLHPVYAFPAEDVPEPAGMLVGLEGEPRAVALARRLADTLGLHPFVLDPAQKVLYHAALALLANGTVGLFASARELLERAGVAEPEAQRLLAVLLASCSTNLQTLPPSRALTGPVQRGDDAVVRAHLDAVAREAPAEVDLVRAVVARLQRLVAEGRP